LLGPELFSLASEVGPSLSRDGKKSSSSDVSVCISLSAAEFSSESRFGMSITDCAARVLSSVSGFALFVTEDGAE
jgi:hypothetical protein